MKKNSNTKYYVYILECADGTLYTGYTTDVQRRLKEHNESDLGAKYTKARRPCRLFWSKELPSKSEAMKEEYRIKHLSRDEKLKLKDSPSSS